MKKIYELCYGVEPTEKELMLLEIKYDRLLDNGYSDEDAKRILLDNKLNIDNLEYKDSIINTQSDTIYYHNELQIHSKSGGFDPTTMKPIKRPYYLEMKHRYTMDDLLKYFYDKIFILPRFRDKKRDTGAMNHLIGYYKFDEIHSVDFILFIIDYVSSLEYNITNPLELKNWGQQTFQYIESNIICYKPNVKNREDVLND